MPAVQAVEVDPVPVDEAASRPDGGRPERVEFVEDPGAATGDAAGAGIEPNRKPLPRHVRAIVAHLDARGKKWPVVVGSPALDVRGSGPTA